MPLRLHQQKGAWTSFLAWYFKSRSVQVFIACMSLIEVVFLLIFLYTVPPEGEPSPTGSTSLVVAEIIVLTIACLYCVDFGLNAALHNFALEFLFSKTALISLASCIPILLSFLPAHTVHFLFIFPFLRLLKWPELFRQSEYLRLSPLLPSEFGGSQTGGWWMPLNEVSFAMLRLSTQIVTFFLIASGLVYILDWYIPGSFAHGFVAIDEGQPLWLAESLSYVTALYFIVVTLATIGYGDIVPQTLPAQILTLLIIVSGLTWIPAQIVTIAEMVWSRDIYSDEFPPCNRHVVICGRVDDEFFFTCMEEIIKADMKLPQKRAARDEIKLVFLSPARPSKTVASILLLYKQNIKFIVGTALSNTDLLRAKAHLSLAIVILPEHSFPLHNSGLQAQRRYEEDLVFLACVGLLRFLAKHPNPHPDTNHVPRRLAEQHPHPTRPRCLVKLTSSARGSLLLRASGVDLVFRQQESVFSLLALAACLPGSLAMLEELIASVDVIGCTEIRGCDCESTSTSLRNAMLSEVGRRLQTLSQGLAMLVAIKTAPTQGGAIVLNAGGSRHLRLCDCQSVYISSSQLTLCEVEMLLAEAAAAGGAGGSDDGDAGGDSSRVAQPPVSTSASASASASVVDESDDAEAGIALSSPRTREYEGIEAKKDEDDQSESGPPPQATTTEEEEGKSSDESVAQELLEGLLEDEDEDEEQQQFATSSRSLNAFLPYMALEPSSASGSCGRASNSRPFTSALHTGGGLSKSGLAKMSGVTPLRNHIVVLFIVPDMSVWAIPAQVLLPLLVFMRATRKLTLDPVVVLSDRTDELLQLLPDVSEQDSKIFANCEFVKGNPRHVAHLHMVGCEYAKSVVIMRMPGHREAGIDDIGGKEEERGMLDEDKDVLVVANILHYYLLQQHQHQHLCRQQPYTVVKLHSKNSESFLPELLHRKDNRGVLLTNFLDQLFCRSICSSIGSNVMELFTVILAQPQLLKKLGVPPLYYQQPVERLWRDVMDGKTGGGPAGRLLVAVVRESQPFLILPCQGQGQSQGQGQGQEDLEIQRVQPGDKMFVFEPPK